MPDWNLSLNQNLAPWYSPLPCSSSYTHYFLPYLESGDFAEHTEVQCWAGKEGSPLDLNLKAINDSEGLTLYDQSKDIPELNIRRHGFRMRSWEYSTFDLIYIACNDKFGLLTDCLS